MRITKAEAWVGTVLLTVALSACSAGPYVDGNGDLVEEERRTSSFEEVYVSDGIAAIVEVDPAQPHRVIVEGDSNLVALMRTDVHSRGRLRVQFLSEDVGQWESKNPLRVRVTVPMLRGIERSGGGNVDLRGTIAAPSFQLITSGGGRVRAEGLSVERMTLETSGGAETTLSGHVAALDSEMSGGGKLYGSGLRVNDARLESSGGGSTELQVVDTLRVEASGGANITIFGTPVVIQRDLSGGSTLRFE
ncbi:hypothetical protein A176_002693 [Myxococcus hansupus]|uniref:Putative auto-transporter adhesin head GIN domain-containing protein n=1 Tax=Pseudomyxococcus hansupus TaxID=1297742 RepID=A0A0H4WQI0_9BACT|nr:head GIN domain-containing protein [Myxococcus hansupus]AKQ65781.1 hypothetical protein A176_002693 [Myxococcus hansupus]